MYYRHNLGDAAATTAAPSGLVVLFEKKDFKGKSWAFGPGTYVSDYTATTLMLWKHGRTGPFSDDKISSVKVPEGLTVTLWEHGTEHGKSGFGKKVTITGPKDVPSLHTDEYKFGDKTSRIVVETTAAASGGAVLGPDARWGPAPGLPGSTETPKACTEGQMWDPATGLCVSLYGDQGSDAGSPPLDYQGSDAGSPPLDYADSGNTGGGSAMAFGSIAGVLAIAAAAWWFLRR